MKSIVEELRALRRKSLKQNLSRNTVPDVQLINDPITWRGGWIFLCTALPVFIGYFIVDTITLLWLKRLDFFAAIDRAASVAIVLGRAVFGDR